LQEQGGAEHAGPVPPALNAKFTEDRT